MYALAHPNLTVSSLIAHRLEEDAFMADESGSQSPALSNLKQKIMRISQILKYFTGEMTEYNEWMKRKDNVACFLDWSLRGTAQVNFVNNPLSGVLILAALLLQEPWWALCGYLGVLAATASALLLKLSRANVAAGLYGYSGLLVGILMAVFCDLGPWYWWLLIPVSIMGMVSTVLASALASLFAPLGLPVFTLPFNIAVTLFMAATGHYNAHFPQAPFQPPSAHYNLTWTQLSVPMLLRAVPVGVGQVYACDDPWAGGVITVALFISSPINCLHAATGSVAGILAGISLGSPFPKIYNGLWSYNAVLGCTAVGGMFFAFTWQAHLVAVACAFFCAYLGEALMNMMSVVGLPALTWPFCLGTLVFLLMSSGLHGVYKLPLSEVTYPEANRRYYLQQQQRQQTADSTGGASKENNAAIV
ncbi:unnamed protein product [Lampetra planeri]